MEKECRCEGKKFISPCRFESSEKIASTAGGGASPGEYNCAGVGGGREGKEKGKDKGGGEGKRGGGGILLSINLQNTPECFLR